MTPRWSPGGLRKIKAWEYAVRFVFGGLISVAAGLVAKAYGPLAGGLCLGFPAILATLTLVKQHDGRAKAIDDARGARLGSVGLIVFAAIVGGGAHHLPPAILLTVASVAWLVVDVGLWLLRYRAEPQPPDAP